MSGKQLNKSKSKNRRLRHNRRLRNRKATNLAAPPVPVPPPVVTDPYKVVGVCPVCHNAGAFCTKETSDAPGILQYCECPYGTERLARTVDMLLGLDVRGGDRIIVQRVLA
jgi:hypothetical protein